MIREFTEGSLASIIGVLLVHFNHGPSWAAVATGYLAYGIAVIRARK